MSARSLNKVLLIGNLTRDPEMRYTPQGTAVCTFGLATNRSWTPNDGGDRQEETEYHRIVAWSKLAEICSQLLYKGRKVYVDGRLQTRKWTGQDGMERETTEVVIDNMIALGAPKGRTDGVAGDDDFAYDQDSSGSAGAQYASPTPKQSTPTDTAAAASSSQPTQQDDVTEDVDADDIPF